MYLQSNQKFDIHISQKIIKASRILGCIKYCLYDAHDKAKLLAYSSLCRLILLLEYVDTVSDSYDKETIHEIEMVKRKVVRFKKKLKGRENITEASDHLGLPPLQDGHKNKQLFSLLKILSDEHRCCIQVILYPRKYKKSVANKTYNTERPG